MTVRFTLTAVAAASLLGVAACGDNSSDVVQAPENAPPTAGTVQPVPDATADQVSALGMNRSQLEDADLFSSDRTKLGEVEAVIVDASNAVTGFAIDVEGPGDVYVVLPIDQATLLHVGDDRDLQTTLTAEQLRALPAWDRNAAMVPSRAAPVTPPA